MTASARAIQPRSGGGSPGEFRFGGAGVSSGSRGGCGGEGATCQWEGASVKACARWGHPG